MIKSVKQYSKVLLGTAAILSGSSTAIAADTVKLGLITDLTSFLSINGKEVRKATIMALEEANYEVAGKKIELLVEDSGSKPDVALDKVRKFVESDEVAMVLGPFNGSAAGAVGNYMNRAEVPNIVSWYSMSGEDLMNSDWSWAPFGSLEQLSTPTGLYAYDELGHRSMIAMGTDYVAGRRFVGGMTEAFAGRGGKVVQEQWFKLGTKDIAPYITQFEKADIVSPWLAGITATVGLQQIREYDVKMPVIMPQTGFMSHPEQIKQIGENGVGIITTDAYVWTIDTPENRAFVEAYKKRWGEVPAGAAYGGYFTTKMALQALETTKGDTDPDELADALDNTKMETFLGDFTFGDNRIGVGNYLVHQVIKSDDTNYPYQTKVLAKYQVRPVVKGGELTFTIDSMVKVNDPDL